LEHSKNALVHCKEVENASLDTLEEELATLRGILKDSEVSIRCTELMHLLIFRINANSTVAFYPMNTLTGKSPTTSNGKYF